MKPLNNINFDKSLVSSVNIIDLIMHVRVCLYTYMHVVVSIGSIYKYQKDS